MTDSAQQTGLREPTPEERERWERSSENWEWIIHHPEVLEQYRGEYVVIWDRQVIAHGRDPRAVRVQLEAGPYWGEPFLAFRVPTHEEVDGILVL